MNITFLIGNGFDRALGLRTGYSHFYEWYCARKTDSDLINEFRKSIDDDIKCTDENKTKLWSDAELGLAKVTAKYNSIDDFVVCCEDMHDMLTEYLAEQDEKFVSTDEKFNQIVQKFSKQLVAFQQDMKTTERQLFTELCNDSDSIINIISLNYTRACDKIHKALSAKALSSWSSRGYAHSIKMGRIVHAHGYVDNYPILGVCDPALIENKQYLENPAFRALMIKKESINAVGETWRADANSLINKSDIICIFGASLGQSDSDYWKSIATWLNSGTSRRLVIYWFDPNIKKTNISVYQRYTTEKRIQDKFLDFINYDEQVREQLRSRIHIVVNAPNMFVLPNELKVVYPSPKQEPKRTSMSLLDTIEKQQRIEERITRSDRVLDKITQPGPIERLTEIEQKFLV